MLLFTLLFIKIEALNGFQCSCSELELELECKYAGCEWNANQCIDKSPLNQPNCSDYEDQLVCDFLQGCAWNNQGKCEQFTKCSDYVIDQYDTSDQCYLKDYTCRTGQLNEQGYGVCQSIEDQCINYANELMTIKIDNQLSTIYQADTDEQTVLKFKKTIVENCINSESTTAGCPMITNEIICKFVKNRSKSTICEWINNQCVEATSELSLKKDNCFLQTGGSHSWLNNTCQICKRPFQNRILEEVLTAPTQTQTIKRSSSKWSSSKVVYPTSSHVNNCTHSVQSSRFKIVFPQNGQIQLISKEQYNCTAYVGANYDIKSSHTQVDIICSTDSNFKTASNKSQIFTFTKSTNLCFSTTQVLYYTNGVQSSTATGKSNSSYICEGQTIMNSTTTGNSQETCHATTISFAGLVQVATGGCDTNTQTLIQPYSQDSTQSQSFSFTEQSCYSIPADQTPQIDKIVSVTTISIPLKSETNLTSNEIGGNSKMIQYACHSNSTATQNILSTNSSFHNESLNNIINKDCITQTELNSSTNSVEKVIINETLKTEIYTFNYL